MNNNLGEKLYQEAHNYLEGKSGFKQNIKKGYEKLKEAMDNGHKMATGEYARYLEKNKRYEEAIECYEANYAVDLFADDYVRCMLIHAKKIHKKNPKQVVSYHNWTFKIQSCLSGNGYYYLEKLYELAEGEKNKQYINEAAKLQSNIMPKEYYEYVGREYGVLISLEEMKEYLEKTNENISGFAKLTANTELVAWKLATIYLNDIKIKHNISNQAIKKLLNNNPKGVLEFQQVVKSTFNCATPVVYIEHNDPNSSVKQTGTIPFKVDKTWTKAYTTFLDKSKQSNYIDKFIKYPITDTYYNCRYRIHVKNLDIIKEECLLTTYNCAKNWSKNYIIENISKAKNWKKENVDLIYDQDNINNEEFSIVYVPFWFFTISLDKKTKVTVRVNAVNGEADTFINNEFGQFSDYHDIKKGAMALLSKEEIDQVKKKKRKEKNEKNKWMNIHIIATIIMLFSFLPIGLLLLVTLIGHIILKKREIKL